MSRPRLDLEGVALPLPLPAVARTVDRALGLAQAEALGPGSAATRALLERGLVPPQALTSHTIFLAYRHYDLAGGIYAREQVTYGRPVLLGEPLEIAGEIADTWVRNGRRYRLMTSHTRDAERQTVVASRSTGIERFERDARAGADREPTIEVLAPTPRFSAAAANPSRAELGRLAPGDELRSPPQPVTLAMMRAQAGDDDRNPIHTDPEVARREGLAAPIAGGNHVLAFVQETMMAALGPEVLLHGSHFDVRFVRPVPAGSAVTPIAIVSAVEAATVTFELRVECDDETAMIGRAVVPR